MKKALILTSLLVLVGFAIAASLEMTSARLYKKQGEWLKSAQFYNDALKKDPNNLDAYFERGELYKDIATSKPDLAKQLAPDSDDPKMALFDRMLEDFQQALTPRSPKDDGVVKKLKKKVDEILDREWTTLYFEALSQDSLYSQAVEAKKPKEETNAIELKTLANLDLAAKLLPQRWNTYGFRAQIYGRMDSTESSAANWEMAIEKILAADAEKRATEEYATGLIIARENLLVDCYNLERRDCVVKTADEILKDDPANMNAIQLKANTLAFLASDTTIPEARRNEMKLEAISALEDAEKASQGDTLVLPDILYTIGQFHLQLADTAKSLDALNRSLAIKQDPDAMFMVGVLYLEGGRFTDNGKAITTFKTLTEIDPTNSAAWTNYGVGLIRSGRNAEGAEAIKKAKELGK